MSTMNNIELKPYFLLTFIWYKQFLLKSTNPTTINMSSIATTTTIPLDYSQSIVVLNT